MTAAKEMTDAEGALMVGDSPWDVYAARAVAVPCVGVDTGGFGPHALAEAGAVRVVGGLGDLLDLVHEDPFVRWHTAEPEDGRSATELEAQRPCDRRRPSGQPVVRSARRGAVAMSPTEELSILARMVSRAWRSRRETCIWEISRRSAISDCVSPS